MVEALKWHIISKAGGNSDPMLDEMFAPMSAESRAKADEAAKKWLGRGRDDGAMLVRP